ncbi:uncharacterized protein LOC144125071 [Amblyomma americanum]
MPHHCKKAHMKATAAVALEAPKAAAFEEEAASSERKAEADEEEVVGAASLESSPHSERILHEGEVAAAQYEEVSKELHGRGCLTVQIWGCSSLCPFSMHCSAQALHAASFRVPVQATSRIAW